MTDTIRPFQTPSGIGNFPIGGLGICAKYREYDFSAGRRYLFELFNKGVKLITMAFRKFRRIALDTVLITQLFKDRNFAVNIVSIQTVEDILREKCHLLVNPQTVSHKPHILRRIIRGRIRFVLLWEFPNF